jgi:hypothetical protein
MSVSTSPVHKYKVGEQVKLLRSTMGASVEGGVYEVRRLLPPENNDFQYRIRTIDGRIDRVVFESQLT